MDDFQTLTDFGNLYNSFRVSMRGKGKKIGALKFCVLALENIIIMIRKLKRRTYRISPYSEFIVSEPKKRIVKSGSFRDKVLQHCLCDYVLLPKLKDIFIRDNYAGQIGKGTLFGLNRLSEQLLSFYNEHGTNGYILKCDISKFFYSIDHDLMKKAIRKYFKDDGIQYVCDLLIDSGDKIGLPLGNQSSQVFALLYLNGLDHYITEELGCKYYGRYMDDFFLISDNKEYLKDCLDKITAFLSRLKLKLNSKTEVIPISKGIRFLWFHTYLTDDGKVIRKITGDCKRQEKKRLRKNATLVKCGKLTREKFDESYKSWRSHAYHGNCFKLVYEMDKFVDSLFREEKKELRVIVAGSRMFNDYDLLKNVLSDFVKHHGTERITIISGGAAGADQLGERYARENKILFKVFPAQWNIHGKRAGYLRNLQMMNYAIEVGNSYLIAFWDGKSKGTKHMIDNAKKNGMTVNIITFEN